MANNSGGLFGDLFGASGVGTTSIGDMTTSSNIHPGWYDPSVTVHWPSIPAEYHDPYSNIGSQICAPPPPGVSLKTHVEFLLDEDMMRVKFETVTPDVQCTMYATRAGGMADGPPYIQSETAWGALNLALRWCDENGWMVSQKARDNIKMRLALQEIE